MTAGIRVVLDEVWEADAVDVYVLRGRLAEGATGSLVLRALDVGWKWEETPTDGSRPAPTFRLPVDVLDAIVDARAEVRPADTTMAAALRDAAVVRDRLLTIVEAQAAGAIARTTDADHITGRTP